MDGMLVFVCIVITLGTTILSINLSLQNSSQHVQMLKLMNWSKSFINKERLNSEDFEEAYNSMSKMIIASKSNHVSYLKKWYFSIFENEN